MNTTVQDINPDDRTLAALTHLSGLAGYVVPLGGILVPIVIWAVKSNSPTIVGIAKQAITLNIVVFLAIAVTAVLWLTVLLIPLVLLFWFALAIVGVALPVVGAIKASQGEYYRYPVVGVAPDTRFAV